MSETSGDGLIPLIQRVYSRGKDCFVVLIEEESIDVTLWFSNSSIFFSFNFERTFERRSSLKLGRIVFDASIKVTRLPFEANEYSESLYYCIALMQLSPCFDCMSADICPDLQRSSSREEACRRCQGILSEKVRERYY